jgi:hypothetical protein
MNPRHLTSACSCRGRALGAAAAAPDTAGRSRVGCRERRREIRLEDVGECREPPPHPIWVGDQLHLIAKCHSGPHRRDAVARSRTRAVGGGTSPAAQSGGAAARGAARRRARSTPGAGALISRNLINVSGFWTDPPAGDPRLARVPTSAARSWSPFIHPRPPYARWYVRVPAVLLSWSASDALTGSPSLDFHLSGVIIRTWR